MHPAARKCVVAAVALWVAGAALVGVAPTLYGLADGWLGGVVEVAVGFLQEALIPTGAVLIGAAVVVQALRTRPSLVEPEATLTGATPMAGTVAPAAPASPFPPSAAPVPTGAVPTMQAAVPTPPGPTPPGPPSSPVPRYLTHPPSGAVSQGSPVVGPPSAASGGEAPLFEPVEPVDPAPALDGKRPPRSRKKR